MIFAATVIKGKLDLATPEKFKKFITGMKDGERLELTVEKRKLRRTNSQNAYYWAYLKIIADETGDDENSLHEYFKRAFLSPKFVFVLGKEVRLPRETKCLSKIEFGEYLDRICAETNVPLPDPSALGYIPSNIGYLGTYEKSQSKTTGVPH